MDGGIERDFFVGVTLAKVDNPPIDGTKKNRK